MKQEDKELLLKDLSEKLVTINNLCRFNDEGIYIEDIKPYLRPMSSMTEEEREEFYSINSEDELNNWVLNFLK